MSSGRVNIGPSKTEVWNSPFSIHRGVLALLQLIAHTTPEGGGAILIAERGNDTGKKYLLFQMWREEESTLRMLMQITISQ